MRYRVVTAYLMYLLLVPGLALKLRARVVNGTAGHPEIFYNGTWNTVCDDDFGKKDASVACGMLGFNSTTAVAVWSAKYGAGSGPVLFINLRCVGNETSLAQCRHWGFYRHYCGNWQDVGVVCTINKQMAARLANGTSEAGRLEILFNGEWSTVCGAGFGKKEAQVACRMLGFNSTGAADIISERYGPGADHVSVYVACQGTESSLVECILILLHSLICPTYNVGVICNITQQMSARVVNGTSDAGRLEIFFNREWSTVCNRGFGQREAKAACRMLGFNSNEAVAVSSARYGQGSDNILLQDVVCKGNETSLEECQHNVLYGGSCSHSEDIGIICNISEPMTARLVNGTSEAGRLEIFFNREWSTVCGVRFGKNEARVSCRMLGFNSTGSVAVSSDRYGQGTGYILDAGRCNGTEDSLVQCDHQGFYTSDCDSLKDVGVICNINRDKIRLTGMPRAKLNMGRVEMKVGSEWQTVCVSDDLTARVICRELGFSRSTGVLLEGWPPGARQNALLMKFACSGDESSVFDCNQTPFGIENVCKNSDVDCSESPSVYIMPDKETYPMTEGKNIVLKCWILYKYQPANEYTWIETANGQPSGADLIFDNLTRSHNGRRVKCTASFTVDGQNIRVSSEALVLQVYYKPLIRVTRNDSVTTSKQNYMDPSKITPGANIIFWCEADSNPPPESITWSGRVNSTTGQLQITAANHRRHTGVYTCTVVTKTTDEEEEPFSLKSSYEMTVVVEDFPYPFRETDHGETCRNLFYFTLTFILLFAGENAD